MILLPATIDKITTMADGSWRLYVGLGELAPEKVAELSKTPKKAVCIAITLQEEFSEDEKEVLEELEGGES